MACLATPTLSIVAPARRARAPHGRQTRRGGLAVVAGGKKVNPGTLNPKPYQVKS